MKVASNVTPLHQPPSTSALPPSSTLFSEQVGHVIDLFQDWNDCERSVSLFAVLKRIPFSCTKFLQSVIDANLTQAYGCEHSKQLEQNANSVTFVRALHESYRCLEGSSGGGGGGSSTTSSSGSSRSSKHSNKDSLFGESDDGLLMGGAYRRRGSSSENSRASHAKTTRTAAGYDKKEDILGDILTLMPILTPGNDEAKSAYLELIPATVEDAVRGTVNTSLVQQIFSYVLIHPAFNAADRRSLNKVLRHLEDHIVSTDPNFMLFPASPTNTATDSGTAATSAGNSATHSTATLSSASASHIATAAAAAATPQHSNSWQAIAPPSSGGSKSSEMLHLASWDTGISRAKRNSIANVLTNGAASAAAGTHKATSNPATLNGGSSNSAGGGGVVDFQPSPGALLNAAALVRQRPPLSFEPADHAVGAGSGSSAGFDDHHISFSKNGTEIIDFDTDDTDKSNTQIGFDTFLSVPVGGAGCLIDNMGALKTRRSNSLTTAAAAGCRLGSIGAMGSGGGGIVGGGGGGDTHSFGQSLSANMAGSSMGSSSGGVGNSGHSGSAQNLSHMLLQKPRSFSLSMASGRGASLTSSGSDTRLDDFRTAMQLQSAAAATGDGAGLGFGANSASIGTPSAMHHQFAGLLSPASSAVVVHNVGMSNICQWLKSLRLHKYVGLFSKITYEEMLAISEEYLQQLNVTKGARHKLVVCIQRLHERHALLCQLEKDLMVGLVQMTAALEELTGIVLTPMRPVEPFNKLDVGGQFLRVLNLVSNIVINTQISVLDEEHVNTLLWILEKAVHNEAFVAHTNQLKEHRYKVARIKAQFPPKPVHFAAVTSPVIGGPVAAPAGLVPTPLSASMTPNGAVAAASSTSSSAVVGAGGAQSNNEAVGLAGNMSRSRYEGTIAAAEYQDLTPTSSMAPWHSHWAAPQTRRLPTFDPTHTTTASQQLRPSAAHLNVYNHNTDSDYHSMTSSQSNSTESLDQLIAANAAAQPLAATFADKLSFDRAVSKPSPSSATPSPLVFNHRPSPAYANDFLSTPLAQLASFASAAISGSSTSSARRYTIGAPGTSAAAASDSGAIAAAADARQRMYQRRDSYNGLTDYSPKPIMGTLFLNQMHHDYATPTTSQCDTNGNRQQQRTLLCRQLPKTAATPANSSANTSSQTPTVLPNMRVPPPNYTPPGGVPVFDATKPPPPFVPRKAHSIDSKASSSPAVGEPKVELYRPRELRQTPLQNVQPPSVGTSTTASTGGRHTPLQAGAPVFVPASASAHQIQRINTPGGDNTTSTQAAAAGAFAGMPPRRAPSASKIAAKFSEPPIVHVSAPSPPPPVLMHEFPSLAQTKGKSGTGSGHLPAQRYIVKQQQAPQQTTPSMGGDGEVRLYQTPVTSAPRAGQPHQSLASIVRTTLPKLMAQHKPTPTPAAAPDAYAAVDRIVDDGLGMANVNAWLKSLRLHKYQWLFAQMSYPQMLAIDDAYLERLQITKGARNKLVLSVQKLNERYAIMERIEADLLTDSVQLVEALDELTLIAQTPMKPMQPFVQADVATKLMKVLNMVYEKMTSSSRIYPDPVSAGKLGWLLDVTMHSEGCSSFKPQLRRMQQRFGNSRNPHY